jgi:hypothetical protein
LLYLFYSPQEFKIIPSSFVGKHAKMTWFNLAFPDEPELISRVKENRVFYASRLARLQVLINPHLLNMVHFDRALL